MLIATASRTEVYFLEERRAGNAVLTPVSQRCAVSLSELCNAVWGDGFPFLTSSANSLWVKTTSVDSLPAPSAQVRLLSLTHGSATTKKKKQERNRLLQKKNLQEGRD